jgi:outer membrane protein TolC
LTIPNLPENLPTTDADFHTQVEETPEIQYALLQVKVAKYDLEATKADGCPKLSVHGDLRQTSGAVFPAERDNVSSLSLQMTVPLYMGGQIESQIREKQAVIQQKNSALP